MVVLCCDTSHTLVTCNPTSLDTVFLANTISKLYVMTYGFPNATVGGFACFALLVSNHQSRNIGGSSGIFGAHCWRQSAISIVWYFNCFTLKVLPTERMIWEEGPTQF